MSNERSLQQAPAASTQSSTPPSSTPPQSNVQLKRALARTPDIGAQLQMLAPAGPNGDSASVHEAAARGTSGPSGALPHLAQVQKAFGSHDVSGVKAHTDGAAKDASKSMGAKAFASGDHVALGESADLHTVAHEAAHVVQQRGGVSLSGGVGAEGDAYEQHADQVADAVVAGKSAEPILSQMAGGDKGGGVQRRAVQREGTEPTAEELVAEIRAKVEGNYKTSPIRAAYEAEVQGLRAEADKLLEGADLENDGSLEPAARKMNARRIEIGMKYKEKTILPLREYIFFVNKRYDTPMGPTYDWLKGSGKNNRQIIDGACRPNPDINKLLAGFGEWLATQGLSDLKRFRDAVKSE
jgi:hypothetical protein